MGRTSSYLPRLGAAILVESAINACVPHTSGLKPRALHFALAADAVGKRGQALYRKTLDPEHSVHSVRSSMADDVRVRKSVPDAYWLLR